MLPRLLRDEPDCPLLTARPTHFNFILNYFRPNKEEGTAQGTPDADALRRFEAEIEESELPFRLVFQQRSVSGLLKFLAED